MYNEYLRGSQWRKWDLHIHSNASDGDSKPKEIIEEAKKKGLSVIALTDHHTAKNIDEIKNLARSEGITIISGIEFRTEYGNRSVHMIGLFPDKYNDQDLDSKALHDYILSPSGLSETCILQKGKEVKPVPSPEKTFKAGMHLVQVDFKKTANLIHKYGGLVSVHAGSKSNSLDEEMRHEGNSQKNATLYDSLGPVKEELFNEGYIDICEIRKENDSEDFYLETFAKPSIIASDAHKLVDIGSKYTWIKADPTFEGLKQILFEPKERVSLQELEPEEKAGYQAIDSIEILHKDFLKQTILLNQNLNSIIGGRSTGKSILLGCIAKKLNSLQDVKYDNELYTNYVNEIVQDINIKWKDKIIDNNRDIEYFPQSYMYKLAQNRVELDELIEAIIKQDTVKEMLINTYKSFCSDNNTEITNKINKLFQLINDLQEKRKQLKEKGDKNGIETEISRLTQELTDLKDKSQISPEDLKNYNDLKNRHDSLSKQLENISAEILKIESLHNKFFINTNIDYELVSLDENNKELIKACFDKLKKDFQERWEIEICKIVKTNKENANNIQNNIDIIIQDSIYLNGIEAFKNNIQYKSIEDKLKIQKDKLSDILKIDKEATELQSQIHVFKKTIVEANKQYYNNIIEIKDALSISMDKLGIIATPKLNKSSINELLRWSIDQHSEKGKKIVNTKFENEVIFFKEIEVLFDSLIKNSITLKGGYTNEGLSKNLLGKNYFDISYEIIYDEDSFSKMSEGKKAFVVLKLLLDFSKKDCPILIDQPEDDLDNRAIYKELVTYLTKKKKERQIIVVSHNPNIVVGADSELVVVANQNGIGTLNEGGCKFQYVTGSLEHTMLYREKDKDGNLIPVLNSKGIREHVCEILEGGTDAFKKREEKYHLR